MESKVCKLNNNKDKLKILADLHLKKWSFVITVLYLELYNQPEIELWLGHSSS